MATVNIKLGDMFDGPADLIVLPCSTGGTLTSFVRERLVHHRIPYPKTRMNLGDVDILPFKGGENIAQYVAYAASVRNKSSTLDAVRQIGVQLGDATVEQPTIRLVSSPLLGAGAGRLSSELVVAALSEGFKSSAHHDARLHIFVLHESVFKRITENREVDAVEAGSAPMRVFISYSHTSPEHERWVEQLATFLRENGIDARLDAWHLRHGMDLPQFMTNELALAERVLIVSDEKYAEKADGRVGGVGWETMIVQGDVSRLPPESSKYLIVVRSESLDTGLPRYLKTKFVTHWPEGRDDQRHREELLRDLRGDVRIPPIGKNAGRGAVRRPRR